MPVGVARFISGPLTRAVLGGTAEPGSLQPEREAALALAQELPLLEITPAVAEIVDAYIRLMPADPSFDALHLALASYHRCEFLVTWNCQHLANANKFGHIRRVNNLLGLYVPVLATPLELLGEKP